MSNVRKRLNLTEQYHVKGYIPPEALASIADDRTGGIQCAFVRMGGRAKDVGILARSCYMQGVNDSIDAITKNCKPLEPSATK